MRTALITGAGRGLGQEVARQLAARGLRIVAALRDPDAVDAIGELPEAGAPHRTVRMDVADAESIAAALAELRRDGLEVDVLINNAGLFARGGVLDGSVADLRESLDVHLLGPWMLCRALVPGMLERGHGRIVNVSTGLAALSGGIRRAPAAYGVSKTALNALTARLAVELHGDVKVNAVCPGWVRTRMGGPQAHRSVAEGASGIVWAAMLPADGPSGGFFRDGEPVDW
jgi:Short-chain dehydrogenases of various substrate specificities